MNKPSKCKNCQWYGKPYWSIINPCDNCPMENVETFTQWVDPTIEEKDKEIERLNNIIEGQQIEIKKSWKEINKYKNTIDELEKYINKEFYVVGNSPKGSFYEGYDTCLEEMKQEILDKLKELKEGK